MTDTCIWTGRPGPTPRTCIAISTTSSRSSSPRCSPCRPRPRRPSATAVDALLQRDSTKSRPGHRGRPPDRCARDRDRRPGGPAAGHPAAHGARPAPAHGGAEDRQRPGAGRRPRGEHRAIGRAAGRQPADRPGARDRRDGPAWRAACSPMRSTRSCAPTRRRDAPCASATTRWTASTIRCSASCSPT